MPWITCSAIGKSCCVASDLVLDCKNRWSSGVKKTFAAAIIGRMMVSTVVPVDRGSDSVPEVTCT